MVKERHHLRAHLTDESMWGGGSDYGPGSVRSGRLVIMSLRACVFVTMRFDNDNLVRLWHRLYVPDEENDVKRRGGTYLTKINFSKFYPQFLMVLYVS